MKQGIHPDYVECKVTCSCGNAFVTRATVPEMHLELCSECHPFYTGQQKFVDTGGRVGRFERKFGDAADQVLTAAEQAKADRIAAAEAATEEARKEREEREAKREERRQRAAEKAARDAQFADDDEVADAPAEAVVDVTEGVAAEAPADEAAADEAVAEAPAEDAATDEADGEAPTEEPAEDASAEAEEAPADDAADDAADAEKESGE